MQKPIKDTSPEAKAKTDAWHEANNGRTFYYKEVYKHNDGEKPIYITRFGTMNRGVIHVHLSDGSCLAFRDYDVDFPKEICNLFKHMLYFNKLDLDGASLQDRIQSKVIEVVENEMRDGGILDKSKPIELEGDKIIKEDDFAKLRLHDNHGYLEIWVNKYKQMYSDCLTRLKPLEKMYRSKTPNDDNMAAFFKDVDEAWKDYDERQDRESACCKKAHRDFMESVDNQGAQIISQELCLGMDDHAIRITVKGGFGKPKVADKYIFSLGKTYEITIDNDGSHSVNML